MSGEYASMTALYAVTPDFVALPIAWGTYASNSDTHFFLCAFHNMSEELPDVKAYPAKVAELHRKGISPNGKFGFMATTGLTANTTIVNPSAPTSRPYVPWQHAPGQ